MTTATATPFVNTPFGVGVVGCIAKKIYGFTEFYVRFEDSSGRWVISRDCQFDQPRPDWYSGPDPSDLPGYEG